MWELIGIWIAALLTLCIYSFLYRDNPFYRFAEHLFVGISVGYGIVLTIHQGFIPFAWNPIEKAVTQQQWVGLWRLIPIGIGALFFTRLLPTHAWLIRYPIAILIGVGSGLAIPNVMRADIFQQVHGTLAPFAQIHAGELGPFQIFGVVLMLIGVMSTLTYFFFSVEHRGVVGGVSKIGIVFLMIGFGSAFGNTVMGRVSLLIQRVDFLLADWLHLI
ncbi:hypothetical protein F4X33_01565 [Candidatus Poribacteria bacterium]|nr:hypothetical protein [Candidatus Poribacteria bacterium]